MVQPSASLPKSVDSTRQPWVEPEVEQLDLSETAAKPGTGYDGAQFADCAKS